MDYTIVVTADPEESGIYNATVPAIPGCHSWGESKDEAVQNAIEAAECCIESMRKASQTLPREVEHRVVTIP